ncbi:MAG: sugar ABC transporter permease [Ruminococcaceae bacterium]|nr:sugar ABC transporter permease [Oscillospiraceae bacterium]
MAVVPGFSSKGGDKKVQKSTTLPVAGRSRHFYKVKDSAIGYLFLLPFLLFYAVFSLYPMVQGFVISFFKWNITGAKTFVGIANYAKLFQDPVFWKALTNTLVYVFVSTPIFMLGSLILALIVDSKMLRGKTFVRSTFFLPNILAVSITAVIWLNIFQPYTGLMNAATHALGVKNEIFWLSNLSLVWPSIILVTFWWNTGYYMLIYLAGLQEISVEQYEAASIDGATGFQRIWRITIPCLKRTHLLILFLQAIASFKIFGQVFLITEGGPGGASRTLLQYIYETGFTTFQMGQASAASFILLAIILIVSLFQLKIMNKQED